ncbi:hypothetical protein SMC26_22980 [Actinomadura fulvescens]|uniref:Uncharacterized protein n=1 Tax=Actinomadura fulvescens TaxID=46160 RepID=A0ABN3QXV0_9ACTN
MPAFLLALPVGGEYAGSGFDEERISLDDLAVHLNAAATWLRHLAIAAERPHLTATGSRQSRPRRLPDNSGPACRRPTSAHHLAVIARTYLSGALTICPVP